MFENPETWVAAGFVIFVALVIYFKVPALITKALDERAQRIHAELDEARRLREEAQALLAEYQRKQADASKEAEQIISQARAEAEAYARESEAKLAETLERRRRLAEDKIARAEAEAIADVRRHAADVAIAAADRILGQTITSEKSNSLIDDGIKAVREGLN